MKPDFMKSWINQPSQAEKDFDLWVNACGHFHSSKHYCNWRRREDCLFIYCAAGSGVFATRESAYSIVAGQIFTVLPGVWHKYASCPEEGWDIWYAHYDGRNANRFTLLTGLSVENPVGQINDNETFLAKFRTCCRIVRNKKAYFGLDASACLYSIMIELKKQLSLSSVNSYGIINAMTGDFSDVEEMAAVAGMSKFHFIREFKKTVGVTPWRYIVIRKITAAKEMLLEPGLSVKQISYRLGFSDSNYFSRLFKSETGMTASQFRNLEL